MYTPHNIPGHYFLQVAPSFSRRYVVLAFFTIIILSAGIGAIICGVLGALDLI